MRSPIRSLVRGVLLLLVPGLAGGGQVCDQVEAGLPVELKENPDGSLPPNILDPLVGFNLFFFF